MKRTLIVTLMLALYGCGGGGSDSGSSGGTGSGGTGGGTPIDPAWQNAINLAYDDNYSVPSNFRTDRAEEILHLRTATTHIVSNVERCEKTEELFFDRADRKGDLINGRNLSDETEMYWETVLQVTDDNVNYRSVYARTFKCDYFSREHEDSPTVSTVLTSWAGLAGDPDNFNIVDTFEYLYTVRDWSGLTNPIGEPKVIETMLEEDSVFIKHTLVLVSVTDNPNGCDTIKIGEFSFQVNKTDGVAKHDYILRDEFRAQVVGNTPQVCS